MKADKALRIWFLSHEGESHLDKAPYQFTDTLVLPEDFHADLGNQLVALALTSVQPATEQHGTYLVETLRPVANKLDHLVKNMPGGISADQRCSLRNSLGLAATVITETECRILCQRSSDSWFSMSIEPCRTRAISIPSVTDR